MRRSTTRRYAALPLVGAAATVALVVVWIVLWINGRGGPLVVGYVGGSVAMALAVAGCHGAGTAIFMTRQTALFWRRVAVSNVWVGAGNTVSFVLLLLEPSSPTEPLPLSPYAAGPMVVGLGLACLALLRIPLGQRSKLRWLQLGLDGVIVALAGCVFFWFVVIDLAPAGLPVSTQVASAVVGVGGLVALVVIGKASVAADRFLDGCALRLLAFAPGVGVAAAVSLIAADDLVRLLGAVLTLPLVSVVVCAASLRQVKVSRRPATEPVQHRELSAFDVVPYVCVAVAGALVIMVSANLLPWHQRLVVVGAVVVATLVGLRQMVGLRDHRQLLGSVRQQQARLEHQANHDPLTGLPNRARFGAAVVDQIRHRRPVSVLLIDIDDFKMVNDTLGHAVGDQLLIEVANRLREHTDSDDVPARLGGDEFAVLLTVDDPVAADAAAARVLGGLAAPVIAGEHQLLVHASIGVATARAGDQPEDVLRNADIAMYAAKAGGKASWARFEPQMRRDIVNHARTGSDLLEALNTGQLSIAYQPLRDLYSNRLVSAEALVRWQHPERGMVPPVEFIPVAERTGLIVQLGTWILRESCRQLAAWQAAYGSEAIRSVSVNVAARQLREPAFVAEVAAALTDHGLRPEHLVLEVTESSVLEGRDVLATLRALHDLGVRLALDDFGTGQSSLSLLRAFPVDVLKLDKSFVDGIDDGDDRGRLAVAAAVAELAGTLGLVAVAEGIEDEAQLDRLRELGYPMGQGYHLGRPMPAEQLGELLAAARVPA